MENQINNPEVYDNWEDDKDLCKLLDEIEKEDAKHRADPDLNVTWEYLMKFSNWVSWLAIVKRKDKLMHEVWSSLECCFDCKHINKKNVWCKLVNIPATINPYLTRRTGMVGMACMGVGKEVWTQLTI